MSEKQVPSPLPHSPEPVPGENRFEKTLLICEGGVESRRIARALKEALVEVDDEGGSLTVITSDPTIHLLNYQLGFVGASRPIEHHRSDMFEHLERCQREAARRAELEARYKNKDEATCALSFGI